MVVVDLLEVCDVEEDIGEKDESIEISCLLRYIPSVRL